MLPTSVFTIGSFLNTYEENRALARYQKQLEEYQQEYIDISKDLDARNIAAKSTGAVNDEYEAQLQGLREVEEEGIGKAPAYSGYLYDDIVAVKG